MAANPLVGEVPSKLMPW